MTGDRVLLMTLSERTSAKGTSYMSGFLGRARVVAFKSKELDKYGNPQWELFVSEPEPRPEQPSGFRGDRARRQPTPAGATRAVAPSEPPQGWLDDSQAAVEDLLGTGRRARLSPKPSRHGFRSGASPRNADGRST